MKFCVRGASCDEPNRTRIGHSLRASRRNTPRGFLAERVFVPVCDEARSVSQLTPGTERRRGGHIYECIERNVHSTWGI